MGKLDIPYRSFRTRKGIIHLFYSPTHRRPQQCSNWTFTLLKFLKRPSSFSESIANYHSLIKKSKIMHRFRNFLTQPTNKEGIEGHKRKEFQIFFAKYPSRDCVQIICKSMKIDSLPSKIQILGEIFASLLLAGAGLCSIVTETTKWSPLSNSI